MRLVPGTTVEVDARTQDGTWRGEVSHYTEWRNGHETMFVTATEASEMAKIQNGRTYAIGRFNNVEVVE